MYIVMEIQTNANGTVGTLVTAYDNRDQAESKYHTILAAAAISTLPVHAAVILDEHGLILANGAYEHTEA
jgi:hypothetical protein